jgi:hypothetical protein
VIERGIQFDHDDYDDDEFEYPEVTGRTVLKNVDRSIGDHYAKEWLARTPCDCGSPGGKRCSSCKYTGGMMSAGRLGRIIGQAKPNMINLLSGKANLGPAVAQSITEVVSPGSHWSVLQSPPPQAVVSKPADVGKFSAKMAAKPKPLGF